MDYIQEYLQRLQEINEEFDMQVKAEPGHYLVLARNSDISRTIVFLNDEEALFEEGRADVVIEELASVMKDFAGMEDE